MMSGSEGPVDGYPYACLPRLILNILRCQRNERKSALEEQWGLGTPDQTVMRGSENQG